MYHIENSITDHVTGTTTGVNIIEVISCEAKWSFESLAIQCPFEVIISWLEWMNIIGIRLVIKAYESGFYVVWVYVILVDVTVCVYTW